MLLNSISDDLLSRKKIKCVDGAINVLKNPVEEYKQFLNSGQKNPVDEHKQWVICALKHLQNEARLYLDLCDLYLEKDNPCYEICKSFLVIYSKAACLPQNFCSLKELKFTGISDGRKCKVFCLTEETKRHVLNAAINQTMEVNDVFYLIFNTYYDSDGAVQIEDKAKGSLLQQVLSQVIEELNQEIVRSTKELITFTRSEHPKQQCFDIQDYGFVALDTSKQRLNNQQMDYVKTKYSINRKKEGGSMSQDITNYITITGRDTSIMQNFSSGSGNSPITQNFSLNNPKFCEELHTELALLKSSISKSSEEQLPDKNNVQLTLNEIEKAVNEKNENTFYTCLRKLIPIKDILINIASDVSTEIILSLLKN